MNKTRQTSHDRFLAFTIPTLVVLVWFMMTELGDTPNYVMPSPEEFLVVFWDFIFGGLEASPYSGKMLKNLLTSAFRVLKGFCLASVLGIVLGFLTGRISVLKKIFDPTVQALRAVPGIGYLPLGMVWFGVGEGNTMFLISLAAFFPVYLNTQEGASRVPELYLRAGRMLGARKLTLFFTVVLPSAYNNVAVGLRLALGMSWAYLVLGEMTGVTVGIGAIMMDGRMLGHVDIVIVCMIVIAITGKLCDWILIGILRLLGKGMIEGSDHGR